MNKVIEIGRLTKDPVIRQSTTGNSVASYTLAVDRYKEGADFIPCVAYGKNAEFAESYLHKGMKIAVEGHLQSGSYKDKEGRTVYTLDVVVDRHEFCESKNNTGESFINSVPVDDFSDIPEGFSDLPFV